MKLKKISVREFIETLSDLEMKGIKGGLNSGTCKCFRYDNGEFYEIGSFPIECNCGFYEMAEVCEFQCMGDDSLFFSAMISY